MLPIHKIRFTVDGKVKYSVNEFYDVELAIILAEGLSELDYVKDVEIVKVNEIIVWSTK